jgi:2-dehydro-3-deoxyphosphogluconate aldolase/(4S)-4-hydroxy-2-oxoglutarate aldolase
MMNHDPLSVIARHRVVPVIAIDSVDQALPLADALIAGGLPVIEVTFRTKAAADVIRLLSRERPALLVGAGTVLDAATVEAALAAGAKFALAPGCHPATVARAQALGLPFVPGVQTPSEVELALSLGCRVLKFFPAEAAGGVKMLEAIHAPYKHTGVRFVPTGGVSPANLAAYLDCDAVAAVGGTWLAKPADLQSGLFDEIAVRTREAVAIAAGRPAAC